MGLDPGFMGGWVGLDLGFMGGWVSLNLEFACSKGPSLNCGTLTCPLPPPQAMQGGQPALVLLSFVLYLLFTLCFGFFTAAMIITMLTQAYHAHSITAR